MGEQTKIGWCDHTFNPWWGCVRVSPGCEKCYAETFSKRVGLQVWGTQANRRFFGEKHWREPLKWNAAAERDGKRARVFCASMADVFEDGLAREPREDGLGDRTLDTERARLFELIEATPWLDWLLLTKRPRNIERMVPRRWMVDGFPPNVWIGTTVEDQLRAEDRIPELLRIPARVRFLSVEPQLERVRLTSVKDDELGADWNALECGISWVICGGESGPGARPFDVSWARTLVRECRANGVPIFVKQLGAHTVDSDTLSAGGFSVPWPSGTRTRASYPPRIMLRHAKGEDASEWPQDIRSREWPS